MISTATVETAARMAADAQAVAQAFLEAVNDARDKYVDTPPAGRADAWNNYTHALDQLAAANLRADHANQLHKAVAHAKHLADAWARLQTMVPLHAVPISQGGLLTAGNVQ